jgi:hypothetical protein
MLLAVISADLGPVPCTPGGPAACGYARPAFGG